jgi:hypothetical protein
LRHYENADQINTLPAGTPEVEMEISMLQKRLIRQLRYAKLRHTALFYLGEAYMA